MDFTTLLSRRRVVLRFDRAHSRSEGARRGLEICEALMRVELTPHRRGALAVP